MPWVKFQAWSQERLAVEVDAARSWKAFYAVLRSSELILSDGSL